jgi:hypothetical protein
MQFLVEENFRYTRIHEEKLLLIHLEHTCKEEICFPYTDHAPHSSEYLFALISTPIVVTSASEQPEKKPAGLENFRGFILIDF